MRFFLYSKFFKCFKCFSLSIFIYLFVLQLISNFYSDHGGKILPLKYISNGEIDRDGKILPLKYISNEEVDRGGKILPLKYISNGEIDRSGKNLPLKYISNGGVDRGGKILLLKYISNGGVDSGGKIINLFREHGSDWRFEWILKRIKLKWDDFNSYGLSITDNCKNKKFVKKVLILPGVVKFTNFASAIKGGGPTGELLQWADLIAGCYALCHEVVVSHDFKFYNKLILSSLTTRNPIDRDYYDTCSSSPPPRNNNAFDAIFTDIMGFRTFSDDVTLSYRSNFRILDVFGTEAMYNDRAYAQSNNLVINTWGMLNLKLKQFYTMFPTTPDNSFLGFVNFIVPSRVNFKEDFALIVGKEIRYLKDKYDILETIHNVFPIKVTMSRSYSRFLPSGVEFLGVLDTTAYNDLVDRAKVCIGVGDPIESPSPLIALSKGCVFFNPVLLESRQTLKGKPTSRKITSQNPYLEMNFGPPNVYTFKMEDIGLLKRILEELKNIEVKPIIPEEFELKNYLRRLQHFISEQDFCSDRISKLNFSLLETIIADRINLTCIDTCRRIGLICNPNYFPIINDANYLNNSGIIPCRGVRIVRELYPPAYNPQNGGSCYLQPREDPLYSCAGGEKNGEFYRICPCSKKEYAFYS